MRTEEMRYVLSQLQELDWEEEEPLHFQKLVDVVHISSLKGGNVPITIILSFCIFY